MKNKLLIILLMSLFISCTSNQKKDQSTHEAQKLVIFHAGSLSIPFMEMEKQFEATHPGIDVVREASGSRQCARKITDLKRDCDIMASADYSVIDQLLIPEYAKWNIRFATNEMCIVYTDQSKYSEEINDQNWHRILLKDDVRVGRSDPNADPCGYRAVLTSKLAENFYHLPGLSDKLLVKDQEYIRPKETDLLALLESGNIDYIFLYRSVAQQHHLKYLVLPDQVNLKNPEFADKYKNVSVEISGKKPGETITKKGQAMVYGICMLKNAQNKDAAMEFIQFVLDANRGLKVMEDNGQPAINPPRCEQYMNLPQPLKSLCLLPE